MGWLGKAWRVMQTHITRHVFPSQISTPKKTHSPSQGRISASRQVGRLRVPMNGTMLDVARIRLTFCSPLGCTAREADSLPYSGMAICFTAGTIPKSGYRFYKLVVKLEFGEANYYPANVGEDIILPPRKSTACCDEWYNMPDILRNPGLRCSQLPLTPAPGSARTEKSPPSPHCRHTICAGPASESQGIHRAAAPVCCRPGHPAAPPVFPLSGPVQ